MEQKFTSLALAFTIDAATIKDRCERQRRSRDQTETNLATEIERLRQKLALLQPLCTDYETVELLSTLLSQVGCNCLYPNLNLVSGNARTGSSLREIVAHTFFFRPCKIFRPAAKCVAPLRFIWDSKSKVLTRNLKNLLIL